MTHKCLHLHNLTLAYLGQHGEVQQGALLQTPACPNQLHSGNPGYHTISWPGRLIKREGSRWQLQGQCWLLLVLGRVLLKGLHQLLHAPDDLAPDTGDRA